MKLTTFMLYCLLASTTFMLYGCASTQRIPTADPTPQQVLLKTVQKTNWLTTFGILGIGLSIFALINGNTKFGIAGAIACFGVLNMSLAVARYHEVFAFWSMIASIAATVIVSVYTILVKNKAMKQIVKGVESFKDNLKAGLHPDFQLTVGEKDELNNTLSTLKAYLSKQDGTTKEIVKKVKDGESRSQIL